MELMPHQLIIVTLVSTFCATVCLACTITYEQMDTNWENASQKDLHYFLPFEHLK